MNILKIIPVVLVAITFYTDIAWASDKQESKVRTFMFVGETESLHFSKCCEQYVPIVTSTILSKKQTKALDFIEHDFNGDGLLDFLAKLTSHDVCKSANQCPTYLFLHTKSKKYEIHNGPYVTGSNVYVQLNKDNKKEYSLGSLVFMSGGSYCEWEWERGAKQDYACFREHRVEKSAPSQKK